jgi:hypothetical protein
MLKKKTMVSGTLAVLLGVSVPFAPIMAQSLEDRLNSLEQDYVEIRIREREKQEEIEKLRGELDRLRRGDRTASSATDPSAHEHRHDHTDDHGDHHDHSNGYGAVLLENEDIVVYSPAIGIDLSLYQDDGETALESRLEGLAGFGSGHSHEEDGGHEHGHGLEDGFNLRHAEVGFAIGLKGIARAQLLFNGSEDGVETEEAFVVSEPIADALTLKGGLFRSGFGFFNDRHSPEWDFVNQPLANYALLGDHGLEGLGGQAVLSPGNGRVKLGLEAFNGDGETLFSRVDEIENQDNPGVIVGWIKGDAFSTTSSTLRLGLAGGYGIHQEELGAHGHEHEEEEHEEGEEEERFGDGHALFISPGFEFVSQGNGPRFEGDWTVRGEYIYRFKDLDIVGESESYEAKQDGFYLEALYGLTPSFQIGARYGRVGMINSITDEGEETTFNSSQQTALVGSYWLNDWARLSGQVGYGDYAFEDGNDEVMHGSLRFTMQLGPHFH